MTTRQYIGARYTPKFMGNYDPTTAYEALSVVDNGSGTTYICSSPTPPNTPLTDTTYWQLYGSSNGAIINLQDQIDDMKDGDVAGSLQNQINEMNDGDVAGSLQNQINEMNDGDVTGSLQNQISSNTGNIQTLTADVSLLRNRKILFIGDSIGTVKNGSNQSYFDVCANILGLTEEVDYFRKAVSGNGFTTSNTYPGNFKEQFEWFEQYYSTLDMSTITDVVVCGGPNDISATISSINNAISTFCNTVKTTCPNAKIWLGISAKNSVNLAGVQGYHKVLDVFRGCAAYGAAFLNNLEYVLYNTTLTADKLHPLSTSVDLLGSALAQCLLSGQCHVTSTLEISSANITLESNIESISRLDMFTESIRDGIVSVLPLTRGMNTVVLSNPATVYNLPLFSENDYIAYPSSTGAWMMAKVSVRWKDSSNVWHGPTTLDYTADAYIHKESNTWVFQSLAGFENCKEIQINYPYFAPISSDIV